MIKKKLYVGRPINLYLFEKDKIKDKEFIKFVRKEFPNYDIEDPNQKKHSKGYLKYKSKIGEEYLGRQITSGMDYYFFEVLPFVDAGLFLPFRDGMFGKGVFTEALNLHSNGKKIFEANFNWEDSKDLISFPLKIDYKRCLTIEETRSRIYTDGDFKKGLKSYFY